MRKILYPIVVFLLLLLLTACGSGLEQNYKNIKWNSTIEQIEKIEKQELVNDGEIYFTVYEIYGEQVRVEYCFFNNSFSSIDIYSLDPNKELSFNQLVEIIKTEYDILWESIDNNLAMFETKTTDISLFETSDNTFILSFSPSDG